MRRTILLFTLLVSVSLSCVELAELLTLSDDTSNDFVLVSGPKCVSPQVTKEPPAAVFADFSGTDKPKAFLFVFIPDSFLSGRKLLCECGVQRK